MKDLVFVTGNMNKVHWVEKFLGYKIDHHKLDLDEIQSLDPVEVLEHKAREAYQIIKKPVLVEDTSLVFHALGRLPGTFIKYFLDEMGSEDLPKLLSGFEDKSATQTVLFALFDGKKIVTFEASASGRIVNQPIGKPGFKRGTGFGFDSIFVPDGQKKTRGEMDEEEYSKYHPRQAAIIKFAEYMKSR